MSSPNQPRRILRSTRSSKSDTSSPQSSSSSPSGSQSPTTSDTDNIKKDSSSTKRKRVLKASDEEKKKKKSITSEEDDDSKDQGQLHIRETTPILPTFVPPTNLPPIVNSSAASLLAQLSQTQLEIADPKKLQNLLEPIYQLRHTLASLLPKARQGPFWGTLLSQTPDLPDKMLNASPYLIGKSAKCNFVLKNAEASVVCKLTHKQGGSSSSTLLECCSSNAVMWNHKQINKGEIVSLKSGDEIAIAIPRSPSVSFIFTLNSTTSEPQVPYMTRSQKRRSSVILDQPTETLESPVFEMPTSPPLSEPSISSSNASAQPTSQPSTVSPTDLAMIKKAFKEDFVKSIIRPESIDVSFDTFPYYLSDDIRKILIHSVYLFLKKPEFIKYASEIPSISRRVLLSGPSGTDIYQEKIAKALAKHFNANLLIFDTVKTSLEGAFIPPGSATSHSSSSSTSRSSSSDLSTTFTEITPMDEGDLSELWHNSSDFSLNATPSSSSSSKSSPSEGFSKRSHRVFKKGDKVKYVGPGPSGSSGVIRLSTHQNDNSFSSPTSGQTGRRQDNHRGPYNGYKGKVVLTFEDNPKKVGVRFDKPIPGGVNLGNLCEDNHGFFVDTADLKQDKDQSEGSDILALEALFEVIGTETPFILFIKDVEKIILSSYDRYSVFKKQIDSITTAPIVIIGSSISDGRKEKSSSSSLLFSKSSTLFDFSIFDHLSRLEDRQKENSKATRILTKLFPNKIVLNSPQEPQKYSEWKKQIDEDVKKMKAETNKFNIRKILDKSNISCPYLDDTSLRDKIFTTEQVEKIIGWSVSNHLMNNDITISLDSKLVISPEAIEHGVQMFLNSQNENLPKSLKDVELENEFERRLLSEVIPANEIGVHFKDIGALESVKDSLRELVMLPLQRPELFQHGNLTKPCKGILLFGPPGTGKTMLAKAVATESGANFINVTMSTIGSKWFGEGEKYARAVFTLASKISPSVIFIDEVDSMLGKRERLGEHEAMRKIKNEFMSMWDGLKTKEGERVLVLAATNRPFDLDDAVLRRLPRRMLVDLPDPENREKILRVILAKERLVPDFPFAELAKITEGFSGSDLKNLCISAAYMPIREILEEEKKTKNQPMEKGKEAEDSKSSSSEKPKPAIRELTMNDFERAKREVRASVSEDAFAIAELRKWNEMYGEGGTKTNTSLSYFI